MSYQSLILADGARSAWPQGEASGTVATDVGPAASNGTYNNNTNIIYGVAAPVGIAPTTAINYPVNGSPGYMTAPAVAANSPVDVFTLEFWFMRHSTGFSGTFMSARHGTVGAPGGPWVGFEAGDRLQIGGSGGAFIIGQTTTPISDTTHWFYFAWTKNGATNHVYVNGADVTPTITNQTFTAFTAGALWVVNGDGGNVLPSQQAVASYSYPAVYTTVLSPAQVLLHYQTGTNSVPAGAGGGGIRRHLATK